MTTEYHKIDSVFKRDERGKFLIGEFSRPEFEYLADVPWLWTEKIDGTNIRIMWDGQSVTYGGKTDNAQIPNKLVKWLMENVTAKHFFDACLEGPVILYGEGYGAGIQSGGDYSPEQKFILFDVNIGGWWLQRKDVEDIAHKLGIDVVPIFWLHEDSNTPPTLREMVDHVARYAKNDQDVSYVPGADNALAEGYVGTPVVSLFARNGDRIITKVKFKDFR